MSVELEPVIGLDLSLTGTGVALFMPGQQPQVTVIRTKPLGNTIQDRGRRLRSILRSIQAFVTDHGYALGEPTGRVVIEQPAYAQTQGSQHDRSGLWWMVVDTFLEWEAPTEVSPTTLKKYATTRGNASKEEVLYRTAREWPGVDAIDDNGSDALWLAAMGMAHQDPDLAGHSVTAGRVVALKSVAWAK